jgi:hypothetical protein
MALVSLCSLLPPGLAGAIETPAEQVIPDVPPIPVTGLEYQIPGVPVAVGKVVGLTATNSGLVTAQPPDSATGRFLRFASGSQPGSTLTAQGYMLLETDPAKLNAKNASGATVSFWYRHPTGSAKVKGLNPLVVLGDDYGGENWKHGIVLSDGRPARLDGAF